MRVVRTSLIAVALVLFASLSLGCGGIASPAVGAIYMDVYGPVQAGDKVGTKEGTACAKSILGLIGIGDASIKAAAAAGGITNIESVDHHSTYLVIAGEYCTIVRGS
jgi:hypothetical protein